MRKVLCLVAMLLVLAGTVTSALAISRWGKVNSIYSYDNLSINENRNGTCNISIGFKNNSREMHEGVFINMYAYDNFGKLLWKETFFIKVIQEGATVQMQETIYDCKEGNPYKIEFKVTE